ncbi:hypothetical protein ACS0TY_009726 [Phlomoides rotata]
MMHIERWHERICQFCATQEKPLFGNNFPVKRDRPGKEFWKKGINFPGNRQGPKNLNIKVIQTNERLVMSWAPTIMYTPMCTGTNRRRLSTEPWIPSEYQTRVMGNDSVNLGSMQKD